MGTILAYLTWGTAAKAAGVLWRGLCDFIATPIGAALIAALVAYNLGGFHATSKSNAAWNAKWAAAEAEAARERLERDASMKAKVQADANSRIDALDKRKAELEQLVKDYEDDAAKQSAVGNGCYTDSSDEQWLRAAERGRLKPPVGR